MRVKQLWQYVPLPSKLRLAWDRLMFSRLTAAYVIFSLIHCFIQVGLQSWAFTINAEAMTFLYGMALQGNATDNRIPAFTETEGLRLCSDVPGDRGVQVECMTVWSGGSQDNDQEDSQNSGSPSSGDIFSTSQIVATTVSSAETTSAFSTVTSLVPERSATGNFEAAAPVIFGTVATTITGVPTTVVVVLSPTPAPTNVAQAAALEEEEDDDDLDLFEDDESDAGSVSDDESDFSSDSDSDDEEVVAAPSALVANSTRTVFVKRSNPLDFDSFTQDGEIFINVSGPDIENSPVTLSKDCLWALNWPVSILANTKREDIVFIAFQFWVLGMSLVSLLNESIPHIFASLLTHVLATSWSAFQINHTANFRKEFNRAITNGACGVSLLPNYWETRARAEFPTLALNALGLIISCFLTWKLIKLFGWQTFKRVGASLTINRIYKLVLVLSIALQLSFFFMAVTVSLWLDSLFNGVASQLAWYVPLYKASAIITGVLLIPWLVTGWFAVRQEMRIPMFIFLFLSVLYLAGWGTMFLATTFRWLFLTWRFFSLMASASVLLTLTALVLGIVCRFNFGKGLPRYLNAQEPLPGDDFAPVYGGPSDIEKVNFPSNEKPIPTFSAAFGRGPEVPPPSQMFAPRMGPRFFNSSAEPFESPRSGSPVTIPPASLQRASWDRTSAATQSATVIRSDTRASDKSFGSLASYYSYSASAEGGSHTRNNSTDVHAPTQGMQGKRWVIE